MNVHTGWVFWRGECGLLQYLSWEIQGEESERSLWSPFSHHHPLPSPLKLWVVAQDMLVE